jgi:hypothetical protein
MRGARTEGRLTPNPHYVRMAFARLGRHLQAFGVLVAAIVIAAGMTTYHFWSRWKDLVAVAERTRTRCSVSISAARRDSVSRSRPPR